MKSSFAKLTFFLSALACAGGFAEGYFPTNNWKVNNFEIDAVGLDVNWAVANQKCQQRAQELWYQAGAQCAQAGGQLTNSLSLVCQPAPGPNYNWESVGRATVYCSVPAFAPAAIPYAAEAN